MNETVIIKEGGLTRRLAPIDKLKVNTTDNKDSMWVPADKSKTGVLHASENGIYIASEDGYEAYSEVIVRVTKDSFDGDTSFDDWDYETPDMDLDNWDPETIEDFELDPDGFDDTFNNEDEWKDIDKPIDIKMNNPKIKDTKISGIDPVSGNPMEVGVDENGFLTEKTLPSAIKIEVPPTRTEYAEGETIDFTGIKVCLLDANGEHFTSEEYPTGVIPFSELMFPITIAYGKDAGPKDGQGESRATSELDISPLIQPIPFGNSYFCRNEIFRDGRDWAIEISVPQADACIVYRSETNGNYILFASSKRVTYSMIHREFTIDEKTPYSFESTTETVMDKSFMHDDKTVFYHFVTQSLPGEMISLYPTVDQEFNSKLGQVAWTLIYGDIEKHDNNIIPVQWIRSDGVTLEDSFAINVTSNPDGAHPQVDPSTVEWNHRKYKANEDLGAVEVRHGSVYMEGGAIYDVGAAVRLGMLEPVDNEIVP